MKICGAVQRVVVPEPFPPRTGAVRTGGSLLKQSENGRRPAKTAINYNTHRRHNMAVLQKPTSEGLFGLFDIDQTELPPAGSWPATVLDVRDKMGVERKKFNEDGTEIVDLTAFLFGYRGPDGRAWRIDTRPMRVSGHPKSSLFRFLTSLLGHPPAYGWDYCTLRGTKCLRNVVHATSESTGTVYARVEHAAPLPDFGAWSQPSAEPKPASPPEIRLVDDEPEEIPF